MITQTEEKGKREMVTPASMDESQKTQKHPALLGFVWRGEENRPRSVKGGPTRLQALRATY